MPLFWKCTVSDTLSNIRDLSNWKTLRWQPHGLCFLMLTWLCNLLTFSVDSICELLLTNRIWQNPLLWLCYIRSWHWFGADAFPCWFGWTKWPCCGNLWGNKLRVLSRQWSAAKWGQPATDNQQKLKPSVWCHSRTWILLLNRSWTGGPAPVEPSDENLPWL